jgi:hypothetical protein
MSSQNSILGEPGLAIVEPLKPSTCPITFGRGSASCPPAHAVDPRSHPFADASSKTLEDVKGRRVAPSKSGIFSPFFRRLVHVLRPVVSALSPSEVAGSHHCRSRSVSMAPGSPRTRAKPCAMRGDSRHRKSSVSSRLREGVFHSAKLCANSGRAAM